MQELFMEEVREQIERSVALTPLEKKSVWKAVKESRFPIMMGVMAIAESTVDFTCSAYPTFWINLFRVGTFFEMSKEGIIRGTSKVKKEIIED